MDIAAVALAIGLFVLLGYVYVSNATRKTNAGFGAEWDCAPQPRGEPVCIKKPSATSEQPGDGNMRGALDRAAPP
jgi:hypothetical protein